MTKVFQGEPLFDKMQQTGYNNMKSYAYTLKNNQSIYLLLESLS